MRLAEAIAAEKLDEFGNTVRSHRPRPTQPLKHSRAPAKRKRATKNDDGTDVEDQTYTSSTCEELTTNEEFLRRGMYNWGAEGGNMRRIRREQRGGR